MRDVLSEIVEQNLGVYRASPPRLREDLSQEAQVANDYRGRLVYELLQNADDAMEGRASERDRVAFRATEHGLWMANSGRALTNADVQGLCGLGASSKVDSGGTKRASIGHKGLGFKSVLEITERPSAYSSTVAFELGAIHAWPAIEALFAEMGWTPPRGVPSMRFPAHLAQLPHEWQELVERGFTTAFYFPYRNELSPEQRQALGDLLLGLPLTSVLFLKHLEEIEVVVADGSRDERATWSVVRCQSTDAGWSSCTGFSESGLYRVEVSSTTGDAAAFLVAHDADVAIGNHRSGLSGPAWEGVQVTEVSVAVCDPARTTAPMPSEWRRFHVFLPTTEPSPYPMLVNGAFATDLSRQRVLVAEDPTDYNAHLIRSAATTFTSRLLPALEAMGVDVALLALERAEQSEGDEASAGSRFHRALCDALADLPLIPSETGERLRLSEVVVPPTSLGEAGADFRELLISEPIWVGRRFPSSALCVGRFAAIASDHGAVELRGRASLSALAACLDETRATLRPHDSGGFEIDPVLDVCTAMWDRAEPAERTEIAEHARAEPLFPVERHEGGTVVRVALGTDTAFYPPRSAKHDLPLSGLRFMCHSICWGALLPNERRSLLDERMTAWSALFDVNEFQFADVMRAAVIPALVLNPDASAQHLREQLASIHTLAAVCQLAGSQTKPDRPLRYQRLGTDRALFNLSRLPVPCRTEAGDERWLPAYRVYFGADWIDDDSVEVLSDACLEADGPTPEFAFLAPPAHFLGRLRDLPQSATGEPIGDDEVDLDEDTDQATESDERARWIAFLAWIGVNTVLRPVHFHDVEDDNTGWLTTKDLAKPQGWAFKDLGSPWEAFERALRHGLAQRSDIDEAIPYLYEAHDLDQIVTILQAAEADPSGSVGGSLFDHLVRHWTTLSVFADAQLALVGKDKWPGSRTKPPKALADEIEGLGDNLWLTRLHGRAFCPTTHGPRRPDLAWLPSPEIERRFGRRGRQSADFLPLLETGSGLSAQHRRAFAERLGIRSDLSPSTFTIEDARVLCVQLAVLYGGDGVDWRSQLRTVIRPVYRQLFELLSGRPAEASLRGLLADAPLLADTANGFRFLAAKELLYAQSPGTRERSGIGRSVPMFVLEAEPSATAPLAGLFGVRALEDSLEWHPDPGESPFAQDELAVMRTGLQELAPVLLARLRAERAEPRDRTTLVDFMTTVDPVEDLRLSCTLDDQVLPEISDRVYFVAPGSGPGTPRPCVVWTGEPWPPNNDTAQALAMALADALGINLVETFIAFLQSDAHQRARLLEIAGAERNIHDALAEITDSSEEPTGSSEPSPPKTAVTAEEGSAEAPAPSPRGVAPKPAAPLVPLLRFEDLIVDGEPFAVAGEAALPEPGEHGRPTGRNGGAGRGEGIAAPGTDLDALDSLGMRIALAFELRRLQRSGRADALVLVSPTDPVDTESLVVDVHSPGAISTAEASSPIVKRVMADLEREGISRLFPGCDILTIRDGAADRLIELKSSGVDARVQAMSWNEWKTARSNSMRPLFWLYLAGNLRADLGHALPYLRAINDPFGALEGEVVEATQRRRAVQLRVREFKIAEQLDIGVAVPSHDDNRNSEE